MWVWGTKPDRILVIDHSILAYEDEGRWNFVGGAKRPRPLLVNYIETAEPPIKVRRIANDIEDEPYLNDHHRGIRRRYRNRSAEAAFQERFRVQTYQNLTSVGQVPFTPFLRLYGNPIVAPPPPPRFDNTRLTFDPLPASILQPLNFESDTAPSPAPQVPIPQPPLSDPVNGLLSAVSNITLGPKK